MVFRTTRVSRALAPLLALTLLAFGCASPPKPATCATVGAVLGAGAGAATWTRGEHDGDQIAGGAVGAAVLGSAGYFLCRAIAKEEPAEAPPETPEPRAAQPAPAPMPTPTPSPVAERIVLRGVNFDFDKSAIRPDAAVILDEAIRILADRSEVRLRVEGHTDWTGTDAYNQGLSERRASSVRDYLVAHGIDAGRLTTAGFGESQPIATNETREGRALNRRVELNILE